MRNLIQSTSAFIAGPVLATTIGAIAQPNVSGSATRKFPPVKCEGYGKILVTPGTPIYGMAYRNFQMVPVTITSNHDFIAICAQKRTASGN